MIPVTLFWVQAARRLIPLLDRVLVRALPCAASGFIPRSETGQYGLLPALFACAQVKRLEPPTRSVGGILLPEAAQSKLNEGIVIACGPGGRDKDGGLLPMGVSIDDKVLLPQYGGSEVTVDDEDLVLFRDQDILGVLKD